MVGPPKTGQYSTASDVYSARPNLRVTRRAVTTAIDIILLGCYVLQLISQIDHRCLQHIE